MGFATDRGVSRAMLASFGCAVAALAVAACAPSSTLRPEGTTDEQPTITVAFAGDVNLGAEMHRWTTGPGHEDLLRSVGPLGEADVAIVNLEAVISDQGSAINKPNEARPFHFRARPETVSVLATGGVDVALTANNHAGDYGPEALLDQAAILDAAGIAHPGSGPTLDEACGPVLMVAGPLSLAVLSVDATEPLFAASEHTAGTCHVPLGDVQAWETRLGPRIAEARERVDVVLVGVHWGRNFVAEVAGEKQRVGRLLVDLGADAVLGSNAHRLQGVEIHEGRPIIHDAAHALFDFAEPVDSAVFELTISAAGVERIDARPIVAETGTTRMADSEEGRRILGELARLSADLGTTMDGGTIDLNPAPERSPGGRSRLRDPWTPVEGAAALLGPSRSPPDHCVVDTVPDAQRVEPMPLGPLEVVGFHAEENDRDGLGPLRVTTYWRLVSNTSADVSISPTATPSRGPTWISYHEPCDWAWPGSRWEPDTVYRDEYVLRPPEELVSYRGIPAALTGIGWSTLDLGVAVRHAGQDFRATGLGTAELSPATATLALIAQAILLGVTILLVVVGIVRRRALRSRPR